MEKGSLHDLTELVGALVYCASYVPVWITWNFFGKHIWRAFENVRDKTQRSDSKAIIEQGASLETLREMIAHAYYNSVYQQERLKCARSA